MPNELQTVVAAAENRELSGFLEWGVVRRLDVRRELRRAGGLLADREIRDAWRCTWKKVGELEQWVAGLEYENREFGRAK
jgi:hypothetical protein